MKKWLRSWNNDKTMWSKKEIAQINKVLIKILAHNICVGIQEVNELGVKAEFSFEQTKEI